MKFQQLRNATLIIEYAGKKFLVDPMLAEKGAFPGFEGTVNSYIHATCSLLQSPTN
jgi:L-ascorbate metabolism protein UlaG (beta-lactamase superfamily)